MTPAFQLFGFEHLFIIAVIVGIPAVLAAVLRSRPQWIPRVLLALGIAVGINELIWYTYLLTKGWIEFPYVLPLHLCDLALWLSVAAALTRRPRVVELAFYWSLAGTSMAILTPDLPGGLDSYPGLQFFFAHGGVLVIVLFIAFTGIVPLQRGSAVRAYVILLGYTGFIALFNTLFGTNYFYLREKPASATLLDYLGPWPVYMLSAALIGAALFYFLHLLQKHIARQAQEPYRVL